MKNKKGRGTNSTQLKIDMDQNIIRFNVVNSITFI